MNISTIWFTPPIFVLFNNKGVQVGLLSLFFYHKSYIPVMTIIVYFPFHV